MFSTGWSSRPVHAVGHQAVEPGALVDFVEVRQRLALRTDSRRPSRLRTGGRSALFSVPSTRSLAGSRSFSPCWYWMPMVAAEVVGDPHGGDVHLALLQDLLVGQIRCGVGPGGTSCPRSPSTGGRRRASSSLDLRRFVVQGRLAEAFLEHAGRMEQVVGDDRVEHAHAAFVEHAHDRLVAAQTSRQAELRPRRGSPSEAPPLQRVTWSSWSRACSSLKPSFEPTRERLVE